MIFQTADGVDIDYTDTGAAAGPTLVLLHGMGGNAAGWHRQQAAFEAGHRVIAVTFRGHDPSAYTDEYSYESMFSDTAGLLDSLGLRGAAVLGHSLGGMIAFMLAVHRPDLVGRLIVEDVAPGPPFAPRPLPDRPEGELAFDWAMVVAMRPQIDAGALDLRDRLSTVTAPTLVIGGGEGSHVPQVWLTEAAERIPGAEVVTLGGGHDVHSERPQEFTDLVLTWLQK